MGRLLKKKTATQKKKKLTKSVSADSSQSAAGSDQSKANLKLVSAKEAKKKSTPQTRKASLPTKTASGPVKPNFINKSIQFLREVKVELKKVTWPTRKQAVGSTIVVLVLVAIISLFLGLIDIGLSSLVQLVLQ
jgi:preprotein translocase subunit SecE